MKYISSLYLLLHFTGMPLSAQTQVVLARGSVLNYNIREGALQSKLKATVVTYSEQSGPMTISWQISGGRTGKGLSIISSPARSLATYFIEKPFTPELRSNSDSIAFLLSDAVCQTLEAEGSISLHDRSGHYSLAASKLPEEKSHILFNKQQTNADTYELSPMTDSGPTLQIAVLDDGHLVTRYSTTSYEMTLVSITTPGLSKKTPEEDLAAFFSRAEKNTTLHRMEKSRFSVVAKKYPVLARIEYYDPTQGGKVTKPFSETYDYRISSGSYLPPSLIDCFIADIKIVGGQAFSISSHKVPAGAVQAAIKRYTIESASDVAGYRPWAHWSFVRSLSEADRRTLATEVEDYAKEYGFIDK